MTIPTFDNGYIDLNNEIDFEKIYGETMDDNIYV